MANQKKDLSIQDNERELYRAESENRLRNLMWTVCEDYHMPLQPDVEFFLRSPHQGLYRAVYEGGFFRLFDRKELSLYLMKKMYFGAGERELGHLVRLCMDAAVWKRLDQERPGIKGMRRKAAEEILEEEFSRYSSTPWGRFILAYYGRETGGNVVINRETEELFAQLDSLSVWQGEEMQSAYAVVAVIDSLYNRLVDKGFESRYGGLEKVLAVTLEELEEAEFNWQDFLDEELLQSQENMASPMDAEAKTGQRRDYSGQERVVHIDEKARAKAYSYMELNYGRSYLRPLDQKRINFQLCRGVHRDCSLFFTEGILANPVRRNYQSEYVRRQHEQNGFVYRRRRTMANRNIDQLSEMLRQALIRRSEEESIRSDAGKILPRELWRVSRTAENRLFEKIQKRNHMDFVVDILMDGSASQRERRGEVAVQAFIISEALSLVGIPHRVQSFCTCWDYTILQRFREYDDPREKNRRIFEYSTSANNRDGLAIRATTYGLLNRPEENRILIILSDARPNDRIVNRTVSRAPISYTGDFAVHDTAEEVRRARNAGVAVLGVFAGREEDLEAGKKIFGRDFAYIRSIHHFAPVVGRYLRRQLDLS